MEFIYQFLSGILSQIGQSLHLCYEAVTIFLCIYLWPIICTLTTIPIVLSALKLFEEKKKTGLVSSILSMGYTFMCLLFSISMMNKYSISSPVYSYDSLVENLYEIANGFNTSFETLSVYIYVIGFICIVSFNIIISYVIKWFARKTGSHSAA